MARICVLDNYDSFTFTLVDYLLSLGAEVTVERNDSISVNGALGGGFDGFLISPGPGAPEDAGISVALARACIEARRPLLGVCLGHQAIGLACDSTVKRVPPQHGKIAEVRHDGSGLFAGLPSPFAATRYHSLAVPAPQPPLIANAWSGDGVVMAMRCSAPSSSSVLDPSRNVRYTFPVRSPMEPPEMLTAKQRELLQFIDDRLKQSGVSPSFDEMREALDLKSKSGVHRLISALEERGFIRRLPNRARALEVLKMPETGAPALASVTPLRPAMPAPANDTIEIPLHGRIAAGTPIEALQGTECFPVPAALLGPGEHYALEVSGDSMVEEGILDGDFALIRKVDTARDGEIVVALIDEEEATLKTYRREGQMIRLDPANRAYEPQRYDESRVQIQGRLAGLIRRY